MLSIVTRRALRTPFARRHLSDNLPYHLVVGLPALSPTMETGTLAEWYLKEGQSFSAGDALAKIETDKAAMDFEAQDDGFVAKILVDAQSGTDLPVGTPIMITVEDEDDVGAFAEYQVEAAAPPPPKVEAPAVAAAPPPPPPPKVEPPPPKAAAPVVAAAPPPPPPQPIVEVSSSSGIVADSPMARTILEQQSKFIEQYGPTGFKVQEI